MPLAEAPWRSRLLVFAVTVGLALRRTDRSKPQVRLIVRHLWAALACLVALAVLGLALLGDFAHGYLNDHRTVAAIHLVVACYGFLGLLAAGFVQVLVPMFALVGHQSERPATIVLAPRDRGADIGRSRRLRSGRRRRSGSGVPSCPRHGGSDAPAESP